MRTSEAWYSIVKSIKADGDVFNVTEAKTKESLMKGLSCHRTGVISEGLSVSSGRGMYEERHTRTWETLSVPDSKVWNEVTVPLGRKKGIRRSGVSKIPALMRRVLPFSEPAMEHKQKRRTAQVEISGRLVQR
jgi:hypothetical protein